MVLFVRKNLHDTLYSEKWMRSEMILTSLNSNLIRVSIAWRAVKDSAWCVITPNNAIRSD